MKTYQMSFTGPEIVKIAKHFGNEFTRTARKRAIEIMKIEASMIRKLNLACQENFLHKLNKTYTIR